MKKVIVLVAALSLGACANSGGMKMSTSGLAGAVVGGGVGALAGSMFGGGTGQLLFTILGGIGGAGAGYAFGESLDNSDMQTFEQSTRHAMDTASDGQLVSWSNPATGVVGSVTPIRTYVAQNGEYCRDYRATVAAPEGVGVATAKACKVAGGTWDIFGKV